MPKSFPRAAHVVLLAIALAALPGTVPGVEPGLPRVFCLSPQAMAKAKARVAANDDSLRPAIQKLRKDAAAALKTRPLSVVNNDLVPPSGDKHDYMSFGPYWWPDPTKPDGLPYIRRDGVVNPASKSTGSDSPAMGRMVATVQTLALAYYFTGNEGYAAHAARLLRVWFLDPETKMNPNLEYGQGVPGRVDGRAEGIIDTVGLTRVVDSVGLLESSREWRPKDQEGMLAWFAAYLKWLQTSRHGKQESNAKNNHATWYDAQVASYALFTGQERVAREVIEASRDRRIAKQIEPDGSQPAELARTKPFGYSTGNLQGMFALATLGEKVGVDLWHYQTPDGRSLRKALDFLTVYADPQKTWPYKDLGFNRTQLLPLLEQAATVYGEAYGKALERLPANVVTQSRGRLIHAR